MLAYYGYVDASGDYYVIFDTEKCNGCGKCMPACPASIIEIISDDFDELVARIKDGSVTSVGYLCGGCKQRKNEKAKDYPCEEICDRNVIQHTW